MRRPTKTPSGRWKVRFRLDGVQTSETFRTKRDADEFCRDLDDLGPARARRRRVDNLTRRNSPTVDQLCEEFLAWKAPRVRSDRTVADYRRDYVNWIKPTFGHMRAIDVTSTDVQAWVDGMVNGTTTRGKGTK